jgi:multicomponent Na+:H+ antiporter subunit D
MPELLLPIFIALPLLGAVVCLLLHDLKRVLWGVSGLVLAANLGFAVWATGTVYESADVATRVLVSQMGNWPAPFGITVAVDGLAAIMLTAAAMVTLLVFIYSYFQLPRRFAGGYFHGLFLLLTCGVNWAFITGDLFNLFVSVELLLMASYGLAVIGTTRTQMRQAYKYVLLNLVASLLLVSGCGLVYGLTGTLNFAELAALSARGELPAAMVPVTALLLVVFGSKTAVFPLWFWLPDAYPTLPAALGGLFAGLLTKVGVYILLRLFVMVFGDADAVRLALAPLLLTTAGITMFLGVLGAVSSTTIRRILSVHVISQVGYMVMGIGLATELAVAATIFFLIHNMAAKTALFLCCGLIQADDGTDELDRLGGLGRRNVALAVLFFIAAMSLVGLPPLSGFFGKFLLIGDSFRFEEFAGFGIALGIIGLATGVLTLTSMVKIWRYAFWGVEPAEKPEQVPALTLPGSRGGLWTTAALVGVTLSLGLGAQLYLDVASAAAKGVVDAEVYVTAVLGPDVGATVVADAFDAVDAEVVP